MNLDERQGVPGEIRTHSPFPTVFVLSPWRGRIRTSCIDRHFGIAPRLDCFSLPVISSDYSASKPNNGSEDYDLWRNDEAIFYNLVFML